MATEKRLIDAAPLVAKFGNAANFYIGPAAAAFHEALEAVQTAPTVDAVEVVHGRWIMDKLETGNPFDGNSTMLVDIGNCSVCGHRCEMLPTMNYCPNCGAKMRGDGNG